MSGPSGREPISGYNWEQLRGLLRRILPFARRFLTGKPTMEQVSEITVRRARPSDAERIAAFVNRTQPQGPPVARETVLLRFGTVGFFIAEAGEELVGLLGWQVENLVVRVTDFLIFPVRYRVTAGHALLTAMEDAARELQCEAAILFMPADTPQDVLTFWEAFGYGFREVINLPRAWREAAREFRGGGDWVVIKQLREDRVLRPI